MGLGVADPACCGNRGELWSGERGAVAQDKEPLRGMAGWAGLGWAGGL